MIGLFGFFDIELYELCIFWKLLGFIYIYIFLNFFINLFIFMYLFLAALGLCCCTQALSSCSKWGSPLVAVHVLFTAVASPVVEHGLQVRGLQ